MTLQSNEYVDTPVGVLSLGSAFLFALVLSSFFTFDEVKKRRRNQTQFRTNLLRWSSFLGISGAFLRSTFFVLRSVNGLCYFLGILATWISIVQPIVVGLYQLSRLHYVFADSKMQGGYPISLFIGMTISAMLYMFSMTVMLFAEVIPKRCGWASDGHYYFIYYALVGDTVLAIWYNVNTAVYLT